MGFGNKRAWGAGQTKIQANMAGKMTGSNWVIPPYQVTRSFPVLGSKFSSYATLILRKTWNSWPPWFLESDTWIWIPHLYLLAIWPWARHVYCLWFLAPYCCWGWKHLDQRYVTISLKELYIRHLPCCLVYNEFWINSKWYYKNAWLIIAFQ